MAKLSGYRKLIKWIRIGDDFKKTSTETRAESVIMADGVNLEEKLEDYNPAYSETAGSANTAESANTANTANYANTAGTANSVEWSNVSGKPSSYTPSSHNHDDRYLTETEINNKLSNYSTAKFSYSNGTLTITN